MFEGFERHDIETEDARIASFIGGSGPPLLLLHGYPQTHVAWHRLARRTSNPTEFRVSGTEVLVYHPAITAPHSVVIGD